MRTLSKLVIIGSALLIGSQPVAFSKSVEFSADAVIGMPQQAPKTTRLYVGKNAVRRESMVNGQNVIEIVFPEQGKALLINENLKSYKERQFPNQSKTKKINPCAQMQNAKCEKLGTENIDGINTEKWQIITINQGRRVRTLHWIDIKRKLAIREFFPDGSVSELKMIKKEKINTRNTEKWQRTLSRPDGQSVKSFQWYDTKLKIAIKEDLAGGFSRELKNIKESSQPDKLFSVPSGYMKIDNNHNNNRRVMFPQQGM